MVVNKKLIFSPSTSKKASSIKASSNKSRSKAALGETTSKKTLSKKASSNKILSAKASENILSLKTTLSSTNSRKALRNTTSKTNTLKTTASRQTTSRNDLKKATSEKTTSKNNLSKKTSSKKISSKDTTSKKVLSNKTLLNKTLSNKTLSSKTYLSKYSSNKTSQNKSGFRLFDKEPRVSFKFEIYGRLQWVLFRSCIQTMAEELHLVGFVNYRTIRYNPVRPICRYTLLALTTIIGEVQGRRDKVLRMKNWLIAGGNPYGIVTHLEGSRIHKIKQYNYLYFRINFKRSIVPSQTKPYLKKKEKFMVIMK